MSSTRNTIETFFDSTKPFLAWTLNATSQARNQRASMLQERGIQCMRGCYEKVRAVPRKAGVRCPLPQFVEWALVGSRSFLTVEAHAARWCVVCKVGEQCVGAGVGRSFRRVEMDPARPLTRIQAAIALF